jgi:hypothetical protein
MQVFFSHIIVMRHSVDMDRKLKAYRAARRSRRKGYKDDYDGMTMSK